MPPKIARYRAGQLPKGVTEADLRSSDSEAEEDDRELQGSARRVEVDHIDAGRHPQPIPTGIDAAADRRLRRVAESRGSGGGRRPGRDGSDAEDREEDDVRPTREKFSGRKLEPVIRPSSPPPDDDDEAAASARRAAARELALKRRRAEELEAERREREEAGSAEDETSDESESESESESSEEERTLLRPVFVPKRQRETVLEKERLEQEREAEEERRKQALNDRKRESHLMVAEQVKKELDTANAANQKMSVDDTDGVDPPSEYAEWKLRHLRRLLRDKEEREEYVREQEELERRRNMTEAEREAEDMERIAAQKEAEKDRTKYRFLQKYYHKGAFFQHTGEEVLQRDYDEATGEDMVDKVILPEVMQVRNFGMKGRTKWTHLSKEDTSKDAMWGKALRVGFGRGRGRDQDGGTERREGGLGGVRAGTDKDFEKPNKRRKIDTAE